MIVREAATDVTIDGVFIPKGTTVMICPQLPQSHPHIWGSDAEAFDPDRWDNLSGNAASPYAFQAFSGGPRVCIGKGLAMLELKTMLIELVKNFNFESVGEDMVLENYLTLRPRGGLRVKVQRLGWKPAA